VIRRFRAELVQRRRDLLQDRLKKGRERLDTALETLAVLCEPVVPPQGELEFIHYFCGNTEIAAARRDVQGGCRPGSGLREYFR
jgi:hypothetical protein